MNARPPKLPRMKNIVIGLTMLAGSITSIVLALQAESRHASAGLLVLAVFLLPIVQASRDDARAYANRQFEALCQEREAAALEHQPPGYRASAGRERSERG